MLSFLEGTERYTGFSFGFHQRRGLLKPILALAARSGNLRAVRLLFESDRVEIEVETLFEAMEMAAKHGHLDIFRFLQGHQLCPKRYPEKFWNECFEAAILWRNSTMISFLLPFVTEVKSALKSASQIDNAELVEILASKTKADLDFTPFISTAISFGCESVVIWLLKSQKPIDFAALSGPLVSAGRFGCTPIVRMIFYRLPIEQQREMAAQAIEKAIEEQNLDLVDLFSSLGVSGENICLAAEKSNLAIVKKLVSRSDSPGLVNTRNSEQATPLTLATQHSKDDIALFLLSCPGIAPSLHDRRHMTPLVCAALHGRILVAKAIIEYYGTAVRERIPEVNRALRKAMRFPGQQVGFQGIPDSPALIQSKVAIILTLLSVPGVEVNPIVKGETLFQFAARIGSVELIEELLKFPEIDVNDF
jgi:hypothetical protein